MRGARGRERKEQSGQVRFRATSGTRTLDFSFTKGEMAQAVVLDRGEFLGCPQATSSAIKPFLQLTP
jgi:hypothetical protein